MVWSALFHHGSVTVPVSRADDSGVFWFTAAALGVALLAGYVLGFIHGYLFGSPTDDGRPRNQFTPQPPAPCAQSRSLSICSTENFEGPRGVRAAGP